MHHFITGAQTLAASIGLLAVVALEARSAGVVFACGLVGIALEASR